MTRQFLIAGILAASSGVGLIVPAVVEYQDRGFRGGLGVVIVPLGLALIFCGAIAIWFGFRLRNGASMPAPVRAAIAANVLFLTFCALEFSDGLLRQGGRVVYWTSILFLPALVMLYGQVSARRWAWWVARAVTALAALWFFGFMIVLPFANLSSSGEPVPWNGRLYMGGVTLLFAGMWAYAFRSLGRVEARRYFGQMHSA